MSKEKSQDKKKKLEAPQFVAEGPGATGGVYDVASPILVDQSEGHHSGRKTPPVTRHVDLDK